MFETAHIHFPTIHSTNTWAKEHIQDWANDKLTLVTASEQTGGRGRFNRQWISPPGVNIYASFCLLIEDSRTDIGHIPQLLALTAAQLLENLGFSPKLKWPNDVLLNGKKVAGILCESVPYDDHQRGLIIGIGLNLNMHPDDLKKIDRPATSLFAEKEELFAISELLEQLKNDFNQNLSLFIQKGFAPFWVDFKSRSYFQKGDQVHFHDNQQIVNGTFNALLPDGSVSLNVNNNLKTYYAGEFIF